MKAFSTPVSMRLRRQLITVTAFAIAMGFLESTVVVYLREILYPGGFDFPLRPISPHLALTELLREAATLVMLVSIGILSGKRFSSGFAWFIYSFAIWDLCYYLFLWALLGWPPSLLTWDVLFLIPTTWTGPVLTPVLVSLCMMALALLILFREEGGRQSKVPWKVWALLIGGSLVLVLAWVWDYSRHMLREFTLAGMLQMKNPELLDHATGYVPGRFPWLLFALGMATILAGMAWYATLPSGGRQSPQKR